MHVSAECGVGRTDPPQDAAYQHLYVQVLCAIVLGVLLGHFYPQTRRAA